MMIRKVRDLNQLVKHINKKTIIIRIKCNNSVHIAKYTSLGRFQINWLGTIHSLNLRCLGYV